MASTGLSHEPLLTLSDAAERLGVHPATLRRWADQGDVLVVLTPGGHRRFPLSEIERLVRRQGGIPGTDLAETLGEQALTHTRAEIEERRGEVDWMAKLSMEDREAHRRLGQRLMGLMMAYIGKTDDGGAELLEEARAIGRTYADSTQRVRMSLSEALEVTMFFRDRVVESTLMMPDAVRLRSDANKRLLRRINTFMNAVLWGVAETYEE